MALINQREVQEGLIAHVREILDGKLSEMGSAIGAFPSVIKERSDAPRPNLPYVVIGRESSPRGAGDNSWLRHEYIDQATGQIWYRQEHRIVMTITCYGEDSDYLLNYLRVSAVDDFIRKSLNDLTQTTFLRYSDIEDTTTFSETNFIEGSTMDAIFTAVSDWTPTGRGSSVIEQINTASSYTGSNITTEMVVTTQNLN